MKWAGAGVLALAAALCLPAAGATRLQALAESLSPGEYARFDAPGFDAGLLLADPRHSILEYAAKGVWDPVRRELDFIGQGHTGPSRHIRFEDERGAWRQLPQPPFVGHAYEHNAINVATGDIYIRPIRSLDVHRYSKARGEWSRLPPLPDGTLHTAAGGLEYFPELGGLLFVDSDAGVWLFGEEDARWERLSEALDMGRNHNFAAYNPVHRIVLFGGGNGSERAYRIDADGDIARVADIPDGRKLGANPHQGRVIADPVSGEYLAFFADGVLYSYAVGEDEWRKSGEHPLAANSHDWFTATPVSTYGVTLFKLWGREQSSVYVYKHAQRGGADQ